MADANTISRIGGILKTVYQDGIVEQQNLAAVTRKKFSKAKGTRMGGDHLEISVRMGGNRAGVGARLSDDPLPVPSRQQEKKAQIYDRSVFGVIKVYDKDIEDAEKNFQSFISHLDDETTQIAKDVTKHMNIMTFGDGTGTLATVKTATVNTSTFVGATGTAFGQFGTRYLQQGDQVDIWDPTFTTQRTPNGGLSISSIDPSTQTVTLSGNVTLTAGDVIVRALSQNKEYIGLWMATDNSAGVTFEGLSRSTYPQWRGNVIDAGGVALSETHLQQLESKIEIASGEEVDEWVVDRTQWDAYVALGQSLKRYINTMKLDRGFQELDYNGTPLGKDVDCPPFAAFAFASAHVQNGVVTPLSWDEKGGGILKWNSGYAAFTGYMREYGNYVYDQPNAIGRVQALQVPAAYLR